MKAALLLVITSALLLPKYALAHTHLLRSTPAENAILEKSPPAAVLVFAEPVTLTAIRVESAEGGKTAVKPLPGKPAAELSAALPTLAPGRYKMSWRALSDDGHVMAGEIHFTVGGKPGQ
jgi:methionine-rich copper-binding protein CopC